MEPYRLYYVSTAKVKPGKSTAASAWWREKGQSFYQSLPGVKSARVLASQFGLGESFGYELWLEIENYAFFDRLDQEIAADPGRYGPIFQQFNDLFESGPSRLMGDWPESHLADTD